MRGQVIEKDGFKELQNLEGLRLHCPYSMHQSSCSSRCVFFEEIKTTKIHTAILHCRDVVVNLKAK
jgi:hypothetical protein